MKNKILKKINPNIFLFGIASFLNDFSSEMITPILPMFIESLGGGGIIIGLIGGARDSISNLLKVVFGYWSDKIGKRKIFIFLGYLNSAAFKLLLAFSQVWQQVLIICGFERIGKGLRTAPRDAAISEFMPTHKGKAFGIHRTFDTAGAIAGSFIVFLLFWLYKSNFKTIIFIAALLSFLSLIPLIFIKEKKKKVAPIKKTTHVKFADLQKPLKTFIFISGIFGMGNFSYMFFILRAQKLFSGAFAISMPILLYVFFNIFYATFAIPFGVLADKIGKKKIIALGFFTYSLTTLGFAFFNNFISFIFLFALYGLACSMIEANRRALVSELSTEKTRGTALGIFHTTIGLAALFSSLIAGFYGKKQLLNLHLFMPAF